VKSFVFPSLLFLRIHQKETNLISIKPWFVSLDASSDLKIDIFLSQARRVFTGFVLGVFGSTEAGIQARENSGFVIN
jgi:hypothetical protein